MSIKKIILILLFTINGAAFAAPLHSPLQTNNKALIQNFYTTIWTKSQGKKLNQFVDQKVHGEINGTAYTFKNLDDRLKHFDSINKNISATVKHLLADKNEVAVYVSICSTLLKTDETFCVPNIGIYKIKNNKIIQFLVTAPVPEVYQFEPKKQ